MKFGTNEIQKVYLGTTELNSLYFGANQVYTKGGFDEYTKGVWHLENNTDNAVPGSSWALHTSEPLFITEYSNSIYKFGSYSGRRVQNSGTWVSVFASKITNTASKDFTIDLWVRSGVSSASSGDNAPYVLLKLIDATSSYITASVSIFKDKIVTWSTSQEVAVEPATWHHIAFERYNSNMYIYIDGVLKETVTIQHKIEYFAEQHTYNPVVYFDEIRLSSTARYKGQNFTPPTQPYS